MLIHFGEVTANEINTMLQASADSNVEIAQRILDKQNGRHFDLEMDEAVYLRDNLWGDADRVSMGVSEAAGRAFERAGDKLDLLIGETAGQI